MDKESQPRTHAITKLDNSFLKDNSQVNNQQQVVHCITNIYTNIKLATADVCIINEYFSWFLMVK